MEIIKADGTKEEFNPEKLRSSLARSGAGEEVSDYIIKHIEGELRSGMTTSEIYHHAFDILKLRSKPNAMRYSLRRALMELGPTGFPFEDFVAEIFKTRGFSTLTDQTVSGRCAEHEVDVIAWNEDKLLMAEAKFHNELGIKSDLKVALYVKARFEDIGEMELGFGKKRRLDEGMLITNTKFSTSAVRYAECRGLTLIGWNYPEKGNLQDMIEESGLHPITAITTLNKNQREMLMDKGVVLCRGIKQDEGLLAPLGMSKDKVKETMEEVHLVC